jgi:hypothetical protein
MHSYTLALFGRALTYKPSELVMKKMIINTTLGITLVQVMVFCVVTTSLHGVTTQKTMT